MESSYRITSTALVNPGTEPKCSNLFLRTRVQAISTGADFPFGSPGAIDYTNLPDEATKAAPGMPKGGTAAIADLWDRVVAKMTKEGYHSTSTPKYAGYYGGMAADQTVWDKVSPAGVLLLYQLLAQMYVRLAKLGVEAATVAGVQLKHHDATLEIPW